jgi:hypothetical protein
LVIQPRRLRAPGQNGAILSEPPFAEVGDLIRANRETLSKPGPPLLGHSWTSLRSEARQTIVGLARAYLRGAGEPVPEYGHESLLMAGHQPDLVHAGVWVKHFALNGLARKYGSTPVNIVVDNDTAKSCSIRLPILSGAGTDQPQLVNIPFDHWSGEVPFEERGINDESLFAALADRAAPVHRHWGFTPLLGVYWREALIQARRTSLQGERFAAARRSLERQWGCHNLEIPVSSLCASRPFAWFACHLLSDLRRFHGIYNHCVHEYRRQYGIRSRNHPVPDLLVDDDWYEIPFWTWRTGERVRHRPMARLGVTAIELRSGGEPWPSLPLADKAGVEAAVNAYLDLQARGFKVRSRALTNTLFARLFLADLFIHGIGGAKYDELTDEIIRRFYGFVAPGYMVLSATLRLPLPAYPATEESSRRFAAMLRDLRYNPQRHLQEKLRRERAVQDLVEEKQAWIKRQPNDLRERKLRFEKLRALTAQLSPFVREELNGIAQEHSRSANQVRANAILQRRDYAFCLFPQSVLRPFCVQFLSADVSAGCV